MHLLPYVEGQRAYIFGHIYKCSGGHNRILDGAVGSAGRIITLFMLLCKQNKVKFKR